MHARRNPLSAGLIAFGVGWRASTLIPSSQVEQGAVVPHIAAAPR